LSIGEFILLSVDLVDLLIEILNRLGCLFDTVDLPVPTTRHDYDTYDHEYRPPRTKGVKDCRSPCPALNTLANHGYLYVHSALFTKVSLTSGI
jgi:hypothetical protein